MYFNIRNYWHKKKNLVLVIFNENINDQDATNVREFEFNL